MHDLPIDPNIHVVSYADDITLLASGSNIHTVRRAMQAYLNTLSSWMKRWRFTINAQKSTFQIYTSRRTIPPLTLTLLSHNLRLEQVQRVLGILFDAPKLSFVPHFRYLNEDGRRRLHILRALSSTNWGCSREILRRVYVAYICSKLEYIAVIFESVGFSFLAE